jgi:hypothetical protein
MHGALNIGKKITQFGCKSRDESLERKSYCASKNFTVPTKHTPT